MFCFISKLKSHNEEYLSRDKVDTHKYVIEWNDWKRKRLKMLNLFLAFFHERIKTKKEEEELKEFLVTSDDLDILACKL